MRTFSLPDQRNQSGKFLSTDGTNVFWEEAGGGGGGVSIGDSIGDSTPWEVLYIDANGDLTSDSNFVRNTNGAGGFQSRISSIAGSKIASIKVLATNSNVEASMIASESGTVNYGFQAFGDSAIVVANNVNHTFPTSVGPSGKWTAYFHNGINSMSLSVPLYITLPGILEIGDPSNLVNILILGNGIDGSTSSTSGLIQMSPRSGFNAAGNNIIITSGRGTGNSVSTGVDLAVHVPTTSGFGNQTRETGLRLDGNRNLRAFGLHNNATGQGSSTQQDIRSGTYTPVATILENLEVNPALNAANWKRVGNVVSVAGRVTIRPDSTAFTSFEATIPVPSVFVGSLNLSGSIVQTLGGNQVGSCVAKLTTNTVQFDFTANSTVPFSAVYFYQYEVLGT